MTLAGEIKRHWLLGQYWLYSENDEDGKVFRRADTESAHEVFLYFHADKWWVGDQIKGKKPNSLRLRNENRRQNKHHPPSRGWQERVPGTFRDSWVECDLQLESEVGRLPDCNLVVRPKKGKEKVAAALGKVVGNYLQLSGRWSLGRRVRDFR